MSSPVPVGVLVSGSGTNLQALLDDCRRPGSPARIAVVISNRRHAPALDRARRAGVPALWIGHRRFSDRSGFEAALNACLEEHGARWVALAGFMRLLGPTFLDRWQGRALNIHPALLPAFPGLHAQAQAIEHGVRIAGATVHFVDAGTDSGPVVIQGAVPVLPGDDPERLGRRILEVEHLIYPQALRWAAAGRLRLDGGRVAVDLRPGERTWLWLDP